jgi:hypothetical protein
MKINHAFGLRENKPNQTQFQRQKMLLRLTINGRRESNIKIDIPAFGCFNLIHVQEYLHNRRWGNGYRSGYASL